MKKDRPRYTITIDDLYSDGEDLGWAATAFTARPAILTKGMAFNSTLPKKMVFADELKYRIVAPAMIPMDIYRWDDEEGEYDVVFTVDEIETIYSKYMKNYDAKRANFNLEHNADEIVPAYVLETWRVEGDPKLDKAYSVYGIEVPVGTVMQMSQITDKDYYKELVENEQTGYSIEGFLGMKLSEIIQKTKNKQQTMNQKGLKLGELGPSAYLELPVGEHTIAGKIYTVAEEVINPGTENEYTCNYIVSMVPVSETPAEAPADTTLSEETKLEETQLAEQTEEEKKAEEDAKTEETEMAEGDVPTEEAPVEENQVESYTKDEIDNKFDELYRVIADLKAEDTKEDAPAPVETKMSIHDKFAELVKFSRENKVQL